MSAAATTARAGLGGLCLGALEFLGNAVDREDGFFSYSSSLVDGAWVNDFENPLAVRYTINTLLGLREAARVDPAAPLAAEYPLLLDRFLARRAGSIRSAADFGLLLALLADEERERVEADAVARVDAFSRAEPTGLNVQDAAWMLWGSTALARAGRRGAEPIAHRLAETIMERFAHPSSGLPVHTLARSRAHVVSFGSVVYFLRSLHEYGSTFGDERALGLYRRGVERIVSVQGPQGEWPWMLGVADGRPLDMYPVFTVHQDSMAMLFLIPALDEGVAGTAEVIDRSFAWNLGENQLGRSLVMREPFGIHRSIERRDRFPRARRYLRTLAASRRSGAAAILPNDKVRINPEVRSYHLGWVLFAWSGRADEPALG